MRKSVGQDRRGKFVNRSYFVYPDGRVEHYDKKHLFFAGGEHKSYTAGTEEWWRNTRE